MFENKPVITFEDIQNGMEFAVKQVRCNLEEFTDKFQNAFSRKWIL